MWSKMREALAQRLAIPTDKELEIDLSGPGIHHDKQDRIVLESKEDMGKRGLASTDCGDALALTWAAPVKAQQAVARTTTPFRGASDRSQSWMA